MDNRRSYLDTLNAGRSRKPQTSLDQLNRSIEQLERQLELRAGRVEPEPYRHNRKRLADEVSHRSAEPEYRPVEPPRARQEPGHVRLNSELDELRAQMHALISETNQARRDVDRSPPAVAAGTEATAIKAEIERLTDAVHGLTKRDVDRPMNALRLELEQARAAIDSLAREDTVRSLNERWEDFERRMTARPQHSIDPAYERMEQRLDQLSVALNNLPDALPLNTLEDKMRKLTMAVEQMALASDGPKSKTMASIEERLDEMSRAIAATASRSIDFDIEPFDRIESRISQLASKLEDAKAQAEDRELDRLGVLTRQIDEIAARLDRPAAQAPDTGVLDEMNDRLTDLVHRFDRSVSTPNADMSALDEMNGRLADLAARLEGDRGNRAAMTAIEARLEDLAARLDDFSPSNPGVDPVMVGNLEAQIAGLSSYLARTNSNESGFDKIAPRLDRLEHSLDGSREMLIAAATEAAEKAVSRMAVGGSSSAVASGLADDLRQLEALTRRSDERNSKTFEAIHDTLLKIVERLGSIEQHELAPRFDPPQRKVEIASPPPISPEVSPVTPKSPSLREPLSPAQAAAAAAFAALDEPIVEAAAAPKSMFGGLARRLSRKGSPESESQTHVTASAARPRSEIDTPLDSAGANRPLEPGSGAPDLNAIMKRVRDERAQPAKSADKDAAKADFIAAARRAAQAAAAEAEVLKRKSDKAASGKKSSLGDFVKARRKPILMAAAAVMIALLGLQMSNSFVNDPSELANSTTAAPEASQPSVEPQTASIEPEVRIAEPSLDAATPATDKQLTEAETPSHPVQALAPESEFQAPKEDASPVLEQPMATAGAIEVPVDAGPIPLREAAAAGDSKALFEVGARYAEGRGVPADLAKAAVWYEKSADLGFAPSQYRIGNFYEKGTGVQRDIAKAKTFYQLAADQGNASAMHNLAVLFAMDANGAVDNESAVRWFTKAANLGVKDSQFNLGILAAKGVGMTQNLEESYKWFALVAKGGDRDAIAKRDEIAKSLRPDQLKTARASVELWKPAEANAQANTVDIPESWQESPGATASVDMKKAIRNVQTILNKNGYDAGGADGVMGDKTRSAIKAFQSANDMEPTGEVDKPLVEALLAKK